MKVCFPPFGYQPACNDNQRSFNFNGQRLLCPGAMCVWNTQHDVSWMVFHGKFLLLSLYENWWFFFANNSKYQIGLCDKQSTWDFGHPHRYLKFPKYSDTQNICSNHSKIWAMWFYNRVMSPNNVHRMANSVDPDQTAPPLGAVWSGTALFAQAYRYICPKT